MSQFPKILGVFSLHNVENIGAGQTKTHKDQVTYWYARQLADVEFEVQPLNSTNVPSGLRNTIGQEEFLRQYIPEPLYYKNHTVPALKTLARKIKEGERQFSVGDLDGAEKEFIKALMIDELNVEANYGLGEVYSEKSDYLRLKKVLSTLLVLDDAFEFKHRARFNKFGMSLRKNGHHDESIAYYKKALQISGSDEHIYFNLGRVYLDQDELEKCCVVLRKALEINPVFDEAKRFLAWCEKKLDT